MPPKPARKRKKVDYEALNAPFMRIPGMKLEAARALLNAGVQEIYELSGRSPEVLHDESTRRDPVQAKHLLPYFRLAVYYAETEEPDPSLLSAHRWE